MERSYPEVFVTIVNSLRQSFCVITHQLFDGYADSKSLVALVNELNAANPSLSQQLQSKIGAALPIKKKVSFLRNKVFGHRDKLITPEYAFGKVKLTPSEIKELIKSTQDIISELAEGTGVKKKRAIWRGNLRSAKTLCARTRTTS